MAHFQLTTGERLFIKGDSGLERIGIHSGKKFRLAQWGGADPSGKAMPALYSKDSGIADVSDPKRSGITQTVLLTAGKEGKAALNGKDTQDNDCVYPLTIVSGDFKHHDGMALDLLADKLGRSGDPYKIYVLQRLLYNNDDDTNLFDQNSDKNVSLYKTNLACGSVAADVGKKLFDSVSDKYNSYHKPLKTITSPDDVKYDDGVINKARQTIKSLLQGGVPVRVGTSHHASTAMLANGALQPNRGGGHFVLIVGCNDAADTFLYVDPWRGGSKLLYKGGMTADPFTDTCHFLGLFTIQRFPRGPVIKQSPATEGSFSGVTALEVIAGP